MDSILEFCQERGETLRDLLINQKIISNSAMNEMEGTADQ
jgi:hypothetical protein